MLELIYTTHSDLFLIRDTNVELQDFSVLLAFTLAPKLLSYNDCLFQINISGRGVDMMTNVEFIFHTITKRARIPLSLSNRASTYQLRAEARSYLNICHRCWTSRVQRMLFLSIFNAALNTYDKYISEFDKWKRKTNSPKKPYITVPFLCQQFAVTHLTNVTPVTPILAPRALDEEPVIRFERNNTDVSWMFQ